MPSYSQKARPRPLTAPPWTLTKAGFDALRSIPGLKSYLTKAFLVTWLMGALLGVGATLLAYYLFFVPSMAKVEAMRTHASGWESSLPTLLQVLLWITLLAVALIGQAGAVLASLALLEEFLEGLVGRIVCHVRGCQLPARGLSLGESVKGALDLVRKLARAMLNTLLMLLLALIPLIGPVVAFAWNAYRVGQDIKEPYEAICELLGDDMSAWKSGVTAFSLQTGVWVLAVAIVPVAGFVFLPLMMVTLVSGVAVMGEEERTQRNFATALR